MSEIPVIAAVFVGQPQKIIDERGTWVSSIRRSRTDGPVELSTSGLIGDRVSQPYHGGPDATLCAHLQDHYNFWNSHYGMALGAGAVGENITLDNITEDEICVGDIARIGTALVQVSGPRVPCGNQARHMGLPKWVKWTITENRTGFYVRTLEPGSFQAGDQWLFQERLNNDGSIPAINRCMYLDFDPVFANRIRQMAGIASWWKTQISEKLVEEDDHWSATIKD